MTAFANRRREPRVLEVGLMLRSIAAPANRCSFDKQGSAAMRLEA